MEVKEIQAALEQHEKNLEKALDKYEGQVKEAGKASTEAKNEVVSLAQKHDALSTKFTELQQKVLDAKPTPTENKSIGKQMVESEQFKAFMEGRINKARIEVKNTILGEGGSPVGPIDTIVPTDRLAGIVAGAFRQLRVVDVIPRGVTGSNMIEYTRELAFTNSAAETLEGVTKPESSLTFELATAPVRTIAHFLKLSKQVMEDAPALQSYVDRRLRYGLELRLEQQIVAGNGTSPNLSGLLDSGNFTLLDGVSGDIELDTLSKAKYRVKAADYDANLILMNPLDWGALERRKSTTGEYVVNSGNGVGYVAGGLGPMAWAVPVVTSNSVPEDTYCELATEAVQLFIRSGLVVEMFEQDDVNVQKNLVTVRAEMRAAFVVFRPTAVYSGGLRSGSPKL